MALVRIGLDMQPALNRTAPVGHAWPSGGLGGGVGNFQSHPQISSDQNLHNTRLGIEQLIYAFFVPMCFTHKILKFT